MLLHCLDGFFIFLFLEPTKHSKAFIAGGISCSVTPQLPQRWGALYSLKMSKTKRTGTENAGDETRQEDAGLVERLQLSKEAITLDTRLVSGRNYPVGKIRIKAKVKVSAYAGSPDKYIAKVYRGNVLVAQELVARGDYSIAQVEETYRQDILAGNYDNALTAVYQERKALRSKG